MICKLLFLIYPTIFQLLSLCNTSSYCDTCDLLKRSWRTVPVARYLTNVSVCFIQLSKSCGESVLLSYKSRGRAGKRGLNKSCSAVTACYSSVSNGISKSKIILISASLISPFNSISTTI